jgi:chemotaxis signal transduction protein
MVRFRTGDAEYAVAVNQTREVRSLEGITPLPAPRPGVAGILERNGEALTVLSALGRGSGHVLVLESGARVFGLLVDEVIAVGPVDDTDMAPPPGGQDADVITGVLGTPGHLLMVVDVDALVLRFDR